MPQDKQISEALAPIDWVLVHGNPRSGTGLMARTVSHACKRYVGDWGLCNLLKEVVGNTNAKFNKRRLLKDISKNILANAQQRSGDQFDLVFKQAVLLEDEYRVLVRIWGKPVKTIYCFRAPDEYIHSAILKFKNAEVSRLQNLYENQMKRYRCIGGQCFEYLERLTTEDYLEFLEPIKIERTSLEIFTHKGISDRNKVTPKMWDVYNELVEAAKLNAA